MPCVKGETRYSVAGKIEVPMSFSEFREGIEHGKFVKENHWTFPVILFYMVSEYLKQGELRRNSLAYRTTYYFLMLANDSNSKE